MLPGVVRASLLAPLPFQEPVNAHSHLLSMLLGNTLAVPIANGELQLGTWQSIILVELDGPRTRSVGLQVMGL